MKMNLLACAALSLGLVACDGGNKDHSKEEKPTTPVEAPKTDAAAPAAPVAEPAPAAPVAEPAPAAPVEAPKAS